MLRYVAVVGALCAGWAPFRSGGVPRPEVDAAVVGLAVAVVLVAASALGGGRRTRVCAALVGGVAAVAVWWLLVDDLRGGLTGDDLPVLAVGSLAVALAAIGLTARREPEAHAEPAGTGSPADSPVDGPTDGSTNSPTGSLADRPTHSPADEPADSRRAANPTDGPAEAGHGPEERGGTAGGSRPGPPGSPTAGHSQPNRAARWRLRPAGAVAAVLVVAAAVLAPAAADAVITRSETRDARDYEPEPVAERPGDRQWAWQPPADVVDVVTVRHGVAVAMRDGAVVALNGDDGRVEWRYARPGAPVGVLLASMDRRTVVVSYRSLHDTRAQQVVVLDADTGTPRFDLVIRSVLVETGQLMPGERVLALRDGELVTGYDVLTGEVRWRWSPPAGCASWFGQVVWGRTTVLVPVECPDALGVVAVDEATGRERWRHEVPRAESNGERQDVLLRGTRDGSAAYLRVFGARPDPDAVPDGLLDAETGRVLARPEQPWTVRTELGVTPLLEQEQAAGPGTDLRALDPTTGATTPLSVDACPARTADLTTRTAYVRACADNGRELTLVTQSLDGSPPTSTPVRLDGSGSPARTDVRLVAAPGAIVVARTAFGGTPAPVVGLKG